MIKPDYTAFDAMLLNQIRLGESSFAQLCAHEPLLNLAKPFCTPKPGRRPQPEWRVIDRRLQALRKAGRIAYLGGKWHIISV